FRELTSGLLVDRKLTSGIKSQVQRCGSELNLVKSFLGVYFSSEQQVWCSQIFNIEGLLDVRFATARVLAFALEVLPVNMEAQAKDELNKKARSAVILCLGNKVLREVTRETTATRVWSKLETFYMTKSLSNRLYLKKKLYTFYISARRKISEHIDEFNKIVLDLKNIEDVMATLNSKEIKERSKVKGDDGKGLYVRRRTNHRDSCKSRGKSRTKSRGGRLKCYIFQSEDHLKRNCLKNNVWCRKAHYSGSDRLCSFRLMESVSGDIIGRVKCVKGYFFSTSRIN
nr:retrovirus-related Pol polyprotein from transposon TNT 1-94 [Tanacetum cinerariifolium]